MEGTKPQLLSLKPKRARRQTHMVEIARSFSFKLNLGNYQSADFFQSAKSECRDDEAEEVSEKLYQFCKHQVLKAVNEVRKETL
jgi:hypothetical protein